MPVQRSYGCSGVNERFTVISRSIICVLCFSALHAESSRHPRVTIPKADRPFLDTTHRRLQITFYDS